MKPIPQYDSVYQYATTNGPNVKMGHMANDIIPLVVCLDGIAIDYSFGDDLPYWSHYRDVPPSQATERIESLATIIAEHYPTP